MDTLWTVKDYENSGRLRRFLCLNRLVEFEIDAPLGDCLERILSLKERKSPIANANNEIVLDTAKRPYRFVYIVRDGDRYRGERVFIKGQCMGKGDRTLIEIEAFAGNHGFGLIITALLPVFCLVFIAPYPDLEGYSMITIVMSVLCLLMGLLGVYTLYDDQNTRDKAIDFIYSHLLSPAATTTDLPIDLQNQLLMIKNASDEEMGH